MLHYYFHLCESDFYWNSSFFFKCVLINLRMEVKELKGISNYMLNVFADQEQLLLHLSG